MLQNGRIGFYTQTNKSGTEALRDFIRQRVYSGDPYIEDVLEKAHLYWKFYKGEHWAKNNKKLLSFNYVRAIIDKLNEFVVGKHGFEINIESVANKVVDKPIEEALEGLFMYNWRRNRLTRTLLDMLQMGGISGKVYVFLSVAESNDYVEYTVLDTRNVVPMYFNGDRGRVIGYQVHLPLSTNDKEYVVKVTEYTKESTRTYYKKDTDRNAEKFEVESVENALGFIPIVEVDNSPMSDKSSGQSDVEDIMKLNKVYNEMAQDLKQTIDYYSEPTTIITGATVGTLKRGIGQVWSGLPADANVFNLQLNNDMGATNNFLIMLRNAIFELGDVPEAVLSKVQHISNTSAAALYMLYYPIIQAADKKVITYGQGVEEINRMTLRFFEKDMKNVSHYADVVTVLGENTTQAFRKYQAVPVFKYALPTDRLIALQEAQLEINMGIGSRREIMERLGKRNIPKLEEEIKQDNEYLKERTEATTMQKETPPTE